MTGGTDNHSRIATNVIGALFARMNNPNCYVYTSDMRVKVDHARYVYPDVSVGCGQARHEYDGETSLLNPVVVFEVTSPSSRVRDHGLKRALYQRVPSIEAYLVIDQHAAHVDVKGRIARRMALDFVCGTGCSDFDVGAWL